MRLGILELPYELVNLDILWEFYVNAKPTKEAPLENVSWVRGCRVPFNRDIIHSYIEYHYVAGSRRLNPFVAQLHKGKWDYDEIDVDICEAGKTYELG